MVSKTPIVKIAIDNLSSSFRTVPRHTYGPYTMTASENVQGAPHATRPLAPDENVGSKRFADFDLVGKTFIVTGGARGLGLALAEALVEAGGRGKLALQQLLESTC